MKNFKLNTFNLQLCADKGVDEQTTEIPAEYAEAFEGVEPRIALETLKEAGLLDKPETIKEDQGKEEPEKQEPAETKPDASKPGEQEAAKQPGQDESAKPEEEKAGGDLRVALKIERDKRKQLQDEINRLRATAPQQPAPVQAQQPSLQQQPENIQQRADYEDMLQAEAINRFKQKYGKEPDFYDPEGNDLVKFNVLVRQVDRDVEAYQNRARQERVQVETTAKQYADYVKDQMADDLVEVKRQKAVDQLKQMDPAVAQMIVNAVNRLDAGQGTPQDLYIAQNFWEQVNPKPVAAPVTTPPTVTPVASQPNIIEKVKQMEAHPRTNQVSGSNTQGGYTLTELERMLQEKEWNEIPKDIQNLLLGLK